MTFSQPCTSSRRTPRGAFRPFLAIAVLVGGGLVAGGLVVSMAASTASASGTAVDDRLDHVRGLLAGGDGAAALDSAVVALEYDPESPLVLDVTSQAAQKAGRPDEALWYARLALERLGEAEADEALRAEILDRIVQLDPQAEETRALQESYADELLDVTKKIQRKRLYANTVDLLRRLLGTTFHVEAEEQLRKLYKNKKSAEALLESGIDVPIAAPDEGLDPSRNRTTTWENARRYDGKKFSVVTDMSPVMGEAVLRAMEQMDRFYQALFRQKARQRTVIFIHKTKRQFMEVEGVPANVGGFFRPSDKSVTAFDPRSVGRPLSRLWSTLFHEASHLYADAIAATEIPGWLNEGTAAYFEGARILPSGIVETNLIPEIRIKYLPKLLAANEPDLESVVRFRRPGSPPGSHYPVAWGLVYFMLNYENEESERIYAPLYQRFLATYTAGGKHDELDRFVEYFVKKAKVPGVETFEDFRAHFSSWIDDLYDLWDGGEDRADRLIARARKQVANKKYEYAVESYQWALRKRPGDALASFELGEVYEKLRNDDAAIFSYRRALAAARAEIDPKAKMPGFDEGLTAEGLAKECLDRIRKQEPTLRDTFAKADNALVDGAMRLATEYVQKDLPRAALHLLEETITMLGGHGRLEQKKRDIMSATGIRPERWRRLIVRDDSPWEIAEELWKKDGGVLRPLAQAGTAGVATYAEELPSAYRYEVRIECAAEDREGMVGLVFGAGLSGQKLVVLDLGRGLMFLANTDEGLQLEESITRVAKRRLDSFVMGIDVAADGNVKFFLEDEEVGEHAFEPRELRGGVGVFGGGEDIVFRDFRVKY